MLYVDKALIFSFLFNLRIYNILFYVFFPKHFFFKNKINKFYLVRTQVKITEKKRKIHDNN
jgi:hypothetical protein